MTFRLLTSHKCQAGALDRAVCQFCSLLGQNSPQDKLPAQDSLTTHYKTSMVPVNYLQGSHFQNNLSTLFKTFVDNPQPSVPVATKYITAAQCPDHPLGFSNYSNRRFFHLSPPSKSFESEERRPQPKLLYIQNPISWMVNKLDFYMLKRAWDPSFSEVEFRRGSKMAVSAITHLVSRNMFDGLSGLLTRRAIGKLRNDVETTWTDGQRRNVGLDVEDIQLAIAQKVRFHRIVDRRYCDVDMIFLALKWAEDRGSSVLLFIEIVARFHREYTEGVLPDWTVTLFKVTKFGAIRR